MLATFPRMLSFPLPSMAGLIYIFVAAFCYQVLTYAVKKELRKTFTADLSLLGYARGGRKIRGTAVICGGSLAGLLSARVCSDHFEQVVIIEPEAWVATEDGLRDRHREDSAQSRVPRRSRVAQYVALHVYQCFLLLALRKLFPSIDTKLKQAGARILPADVAMHLSGIPVLTPYHKYPNGGLPASMFFTRPAYETILRRMVLATCSNVKYLTRSVTGVIPHKSLNAVTSVVIRAPGDETSTTIPAVMVVDCTGAATGGLRWLQDASFCADSSANFEKSCLPLKDLKITYDHKMAYTTCEFEISPRLFDKIKTAVLPRNYETDANLYIYLPKAGRENNTLLISRREGNYLQVVFGGWNLRERVASICDLKECVSTLKPDRPIPGYVFALLDFLEGEDVPATYIHSRVPPAVYVQYFRAAQLPSNFVAVGDSVLQLNPVWGVGCTKACIDAVTLNGLLARCEAVPSGDSDAEADMLPEDFSRIFFTKQANTTGYMWEEKKIHDYGWPSTVPTPGDDPKTHGAWTRWYSSKILPLATRDREVASVVWHVSNFLAPPAELLWPNIVVKVLWTQLRENMIRWSNLGYRYI